MSVAGVSIPHLLPTADGNRVALRGGKITVTDWPDFEGECEVRPLEAPGA